MDGKNGERVGGSEGGPSRTDPALDENEAARDASLRRDRVLNQIIGERVRQARRHAGLSAGELGQGIGLSYLEVQRLESGQDSIAASVLSVIAAVVDRPVPWFFGTICSTNPGEPSEALLLEPLALLAPRPAPITASDILRLERERGLERRAAPPSAIQGTVLLVDDDSDVLTMAGKHIEKAGYRTIKVEDAHAALQLVGSGQPLAAIVTDYAMPGMNGAQLLAEVAMLRPGLPALIITGYVDSAGMELLGAGVEILRKPFMRAELITRLYRLIVSGQPTPAPADASVPGPWFPLGGW